MFADMQITVDDAVRELIIKEGQDYRVCTACSGPVLVPITMKPPKGSDIVIPIGDNHLYVSVVQASYLRRITIDMTYDPDRMFSCEVLNAFR
jgi:hypothetical protein